MSETTKTITQFADLVHFVETKTSKIAELEKQLDTQTDIVEIQISNLLSSFQDVISEIETNHRTAMKAWRQSHKIYADFIRKNPGSNLIKPPAGMPTRPQELQKIRNYIRLFKSLVADKLKVKMTFLQELFQVTSTALINSYTTRDNWVMASTGSLMALNCSSINTVDTYPTHSLTNTTQG